MEGTDSKERGGQNNMGFERKISLFALSMAEVLMVNMWFQDIGRYNASNYALLKTVFELNLQLFAKSRNTKTLLLFVIRDYFEVTDVSTLKDQIREDIDQIWSTLMKPDEYKFSSANDFFDFDFVALPHYVLARQKFDDAVSELRNRFKSDSKHFIFEKKYKKSVPIDGLNHYAGSIWKTIQENKDLDIPSQQEMLALFRCGEISKDVLKPFDEQVAKWTKVMEAKLLVKNFGLEGKSLCESILVAFAKETKLYSRVVVEQTEADLLDKMKKEIKNLFGMQVVNLRNHSKKSFETTLSSITLNSILSNFDETIIKYKRHVGEFFEDHVKESMYPGEKWEYDMSYKEDMDKYAGETRLVQISRILEKEKELLEMEMGHSIGGCLDVPAKELWSILRMNYAASLEKQLAHLNDEAFLGMALLEDEKRENNKILREKAETIISQKLNDYVNFLSLKMHKKFDEEFRYDSGHIPRIFKNAKEIKDAFMKARNSALTLLDLFFLNRLTDSRLDYIHLQLPNGIDEEISFSFPKVESKFVIKNEPECRRLYEEFVFQIESSYADAQKTMLLHTQQGSIPIYFWIALLVLGWNEITTILFNPLYLAMTIVVIVYILSNTQSEKVKEFLKTQPALYFGVQMLQEKLGFQIFDLTEEKKEKKKEFTPIRKSDKDQDNKEK